ncbi:MAG: hypothetical protein J6O40_02360 [Ruminococcus sp.]|nr:hypothetical protein [Ruminococcus sp.]
MNEKFEELIKDLPEELQEKAKNCASFEELSELLADNDIEIPDEVLKMVAGGNACDEMGEKPPCPLCGHSPVGVLLTGNFKCDSCGCVFDTKCNVVEVQVKNEKNNHQTIIKRLRI